MFPAPDPVPVYVEYDCRGQRTRKEFDNGLDPACATFFKAKSKAGKHPILKRADGQRAHVPTVTALLPTERPAPTVYVQYDGTKVTKGLRKRVLKKFPTGWGRNGLKREVKKFWHAKTREGKKPVILDANRVPLFGPNSRYKTHRPDEQQLNEQQETATFSPHGEERAVVEHVQGDPQSCGLLFHNPPTQLPD
jgi:hypothetical protein